MSITDRNSTWFLEREEDKNGEKKERKKKHEVVYRKLILDKAYIIHYVLALHSSTLLRRQTS